jgi:hypothetical protein
MEVSGQPHTSAASPSGKDPGTHWTGGWVGLPADPNVLDDLPISRFELRII